MELLKEQRSLIEKLVKASPKYSGNEDLLEDFCSETYQKSYLILQTIKDENSLENYLKKVVSSAIMDVLKNSGRITRSTKGYNSIKEIPAIDFEALKSAHAKVQQSMVNSVEPQQKNAAEITIVETGTEPVSDFIEEENDAETSVEIDYAETEPEMSVEPEFEPDIVPQNEPETDNSALPDGIDEVDIQTASYDPVFGDLAQSTMGYNKPYILNDDLLNVKDPRESIEEQVIRKDIIENIMSLVQKIHEEYPQEMYLKLFYERYFLQLKQREISQNLGISQAEVSKRLVQLSRLIKDKLY